MRRACATLFVIVACLAVTGCTSLAYQRAADHRVANPYDGDIPVGSGQPGREFFDRRLRDIVIGIEVMEIETDEAGVTSVFVADGDEQARFQWFSATPITDDGYALTSVHEGKRYELPAGRERLTAVLPRERGSNRFGSVVWLWCALDADIALVKIEGIEVMPFEWSDDVAVGQTAYLGGVRTMSPAEGTVVEIDRDFESESAGAVALARIFHSAPARSGDSGGALVDREGRLLGINVATRPGLFRARDSRTIAIRPGWAGLEKIIAAYEANPESGYETGAEACSAD
jgi:hypothetical protein